MVNPEGNNGGQKNRPTRRGILKNFPLLVFLLLLAFLILFSGPNNVLEEIKKSPILIILLVLIGIIGLIYFLLILINSNETNNKHSESFSLWKRLLEFFEPSSSESSNYSKDHLKGLQKKDIKEMFEEFFEEKMNSNKIVKPIDLKQLKIEFKDEFSCKEKYKKYIHDKDRTISQPELDFIISKLLEHPTFLQFIELSLKSNNPYKEVSSSSLISEEEITSSVLDQMRNSYSFEIFIKEKLNEILSKSQYNKSTNIKDRGLENLNAIITIHEKSIGQLQNSISKLLSQENFISDEKIQAYLKSPEFYNYLNSNFFDGLNKQFLSLKKEINNIGKEVDLTFLKNKDKMSELEKLIKKQQSSSLSLQKREEEYSRKKDFRDAAISPQSPNSSFSEFRNNVDTKIFYSSAPRKLKNGQPLFSSKHLLKSFSQRVTIYKLYINEKVGIGYYELLTDLDTLNHAFSMSDNLVNTAMNVVGSLSDERKIRIKDQKPGEITLSEEAFGWEITKKGIIYI